ncbi:hypothetical protein Tco_1387071 [Tanacetum coccineum]
MEQYLTHTDYALWEVIVNGDAPAAVASTSGVEGLIPPKTAEQKLARKNELKVKSTLLLAIPDEHLLKFHGVKDAKTLWEAIKTRSEGLDKTYDRFQKLISQLEIHGEVISQEDTNLKLLRSLPSAWNTQTLIMRNKSDLETLSMDDLYNNLKVYEAEIKGQSSSSSNSHNVAFVSLDNTSSTNKAVNTAHDVSAASSQGQASSSTYADDVIYQAEEGPTDFALLSHSSLGSSSSDTELEEALKEKDDLKLKLENFEESSKNLTKLINSQISAKDKIGLGYDSQINESEAVHSVFNSRESDVDDSPVNDRFKTSEGFHVVPPPYTRNYKPPRPDLSFAGLDESVFMSAVRKTTTSVPKTETSISKTSKDIIEKPKTVRPSASIIEEWDTDNDNDSVFRPKSNQTKPKFTKINFVKSGENVKSVNKENTHRQVEYPRKSQSPRGNRRNWNGMMTQKLGNGFEFIKKACFVCGSFNHLIKYCDFHDNKMVEKSVLNNKGRVTAVATKSRQMPVNAAKQSSPRAAASISTARTVNTATPKPKVNDALPTIYSYFKAHSPGNPQYALQDQGIFDSGCSRHMTGNKFYLSYYLEIDGGFVAFGRSPKGGKITGKGKIRTRN